MKKNRQHIAITMLWGFLSFALNGYIYLYLTPRITNTIGIEANGFVTLAKTFISYADIVMTALNSYAARYLSIAYIKEEKDKYVKYFTTVLIGDGIIGGIIFSLGILFAVNISSFLTITPNLVSDVKLLFIISFLTFYIKTLSTVYIASGHVKNRIDVVNIVRGISYISEIIILIICFTRKEFNIWQVGLATLVSTSVVFVGMYGFTKNNIPEARPQIRAFSRSALKELVINGIWNSANSLGNTLNSGLDLLVSNLMLSELAMGQVSVAKTISSVLIMLYIIIVQPFQPRFLDAYSKNDKQRLMNLFRKSMLLCGVMTNTIFAVFCAVGTDFLKLWIPGQDNITIYYLSVIALLPCISEGVVYPLYYIYVLTVKNRIPCLITIVGGLINVISMYVLLRFTNLGSYAVVATTAVIMNVINLVTNPLYMSRCINVSRLEIYKPILMHLFLCTVSTALSVFATRLLPSSSTWISLIAKVIILAMVSILVQLIMAKLLIMKNKCENYLVP